MDEATSIVVVYQRQEFYVSTQASSDRTTLSVDLLQCQLLSLTGVMPDEQILVSSNTGEVLYARHKTDVVTVTVPVESRPRFLLFSSAPSPSHLPEMANDWRQICTKSTFGDAALVQPAFRKTTPSERDPLATLICEPCAKTCTTGFQPVRPMEWDASQRMAMRFISDVAVVAGDVDIVAPSGYTKLPVALNYSASGDYVYLCVKRGGPRALTQIHISLEQRDARDALSFGLFKPEKMIWCGFNSNGTACKETGTEMYIGYDSVQLQGHKEHLETLAITDIAIGVGNQPAPSPTYIKVAQNINEGAMGSLPVFLYYRLSPLGGFTCASGREHSEFGECLFAARHLTGVNSVLDFDERRLTIAQAALALERKREDAAIMEDHYRQHQPSMLKRLHSGLQRAQSYERKEMQEEALKRIPVDKLHERARANPSPMPLYQDELVKQLLHWFKREFFTWMNQPCCSVCHHDKTRMVRTEGPSTAEEVAGQASRVEVYECSACSACTRFPRYNDPVMLLDTRTGRCGEWANCFTLCCRAMGFEARYVLDVTDHVWTEVYSEHYKRWLHCDSCEDQLDCPLTYEVGWGKKLSYIFSFGHDEVVDTTRRYTQKWPEVLARRQDVSEKWLETTISQINRGLRERQHPDRVAILTARAASERDELLSGRCVQKTEVKGRVSGSTEWKTQRNEAGKQEEVHVSLTNALASATTSTSMPVEEVMQEVCRNLVVGCQSLGCSSPFCFTGRTRLNDSGVPTEVNERATQAIQVVTALSSIGFSSESLTMLLCPQQATELRAFLWKYRPTLYLPLQDVPSAQPVPLLDISGHENHTQNSQRCALRKPFRIPNSSRKDDTYNGAGSQRNDGAFGLQLLGGKALSISGQDLLPTTDFVLSFLARFDLNEALEANEADVVKVVAGRIGSPGSFSTMEFGILWSNSKRQFLCEIQSNSGRSETTVCTPSLLAFGQYAHIALLRGVDTVAMCINGIKTLVLDRPCRMGTSNVTIQGPDSAYPGVAAVISHVAVIPAQSFKELETFCVGMKSFVSAPPLKAFGPDGERSGERCTELTVGAQSDYRVTQVLMWGDDFFDGIQFVYEKTLTPDEANAASALTFGSLIGNAKAKRQATEATVSLDLLPDEIVARVSGRKGAWIDSITLHTNFGRSITCGGKGGGDFLVPTPADIEIRSISFKIGDHLTDLSVFVLQISSTKTLECKVLQDLERILPSSEHSTRQKAISAAIRYLTAIVQQPEESKFQRIRTSNTFFASNIGVLGRNVAKSFMDWCGFEETVDEGDEYFTFRSCQLHGQASVQRLAAEAFKRLHFLKNFGTQ